MITLSFKPLRGAPNLPPPAALLLTVLLLTLLIPASGFSQVYELTPLPFYGASGINDSGDVSGFGFGHGFALIDGLTINLGPGMTAGINNARQVVGTMTDSADPGKVRAFIWQDFTITPLYKPPESSTIAAAVNDSGDVVGTVEYPSGFNNPFLWKDGVYTELGSIGDTGTGAAGINNAGIVVGSGRINDTSVHAWVWNGGMTDLGTLGGDNSAATAINNAGQVVGSSSTIGGHGIRAFLYSGGGMSSLGYIDAPDTVEGYSDAYGINDSGEVVGQSTWAENPLTHGYHAYVWKGGVMTDLNAVADTAGGYILNRAIAINNRGDIISWAARNGTPLSVYLKKLPIHIKKPAGGETFIGGDTDTIRWNAPKGRQLRIEYTSDDRAASPAWVTIATNVVSDSNRYLWKVPDTVNTFFGAVRIVDVADPAKQARSKRFSIRALEMVRLEPDSTFTRFVQGIDSWSFANSGATMWPASWHFQFLYQGGTDPFLNEPYPDENPFDSAKSSDFPDWELFVRTFGEDQCYKPEFLGFGRDRYPLAVAKWKAVKGVWNGSCSGLSLAAILGFDDRDAVVSAYPTFPTAPILNGVGMSDTLRLLINGLFLHWDGRQHLDYARWGLSGGARDFLTDLRESFLDESYDHRYLYFAGRLSNGKTYAHAVVPYKLERDTANPGWYNVRIFDVSYPTNNTAVIRIDSTADSATAPLWSGTKLTKLGLMDPASTYLQPPILGRSLPPALLPAAGQSAGAAAEPASHSIEIWPSPTSSIRIARTGWGEIGYDGGVLIDSMAEGLVLIPPTGAPSPPAVYTLSGDLIGNPGEHYRMTLDGFTEPSVRVSAFVYPGVFIYERDDADSTQTDELTCGTDLAVHNPDAAGKTVTLESIGYRNGGEMRYRLTGLTLAQDDSLRIAQDQATLTLVNSGTSKVAGVFAKVVWYYKPTATFLNPALPIPGNSTLTIVPDDDSLGNLRVLVDNGSDGSIDDTTWADNVLLGVNDPAPGAIPSSYVLRPNYPNPFNPVTTFSYDLPRASRVSFRIYDLLGREVAVVVDGRQEAGVKSVRWDAGGLPGGVYFYRLRADEFTATGKLVLAK